MSGHAFPTCILLLEISLGHTEPGASNIQEHCDREQRALAQVRAFDPGVALVLALGTADERWSAVIAMGMRKFATGRTVTQSQDCVERGQEVLGGVRRRDAAESSRSRMGM